MGQEFATSGKRYDLYARTLPLAVARYLVSRCASRGHHGARGHRILLVDVKKAFLYGRISRRVYVEIPAEDDQAPQGDYVGLLNKALYGTRDAPAVWQEELERTLRNLGFRACMVTPCLYVHQGTGVRIVAHVDDLLVEGDKDELHTFLKQLSAKYDVKSTVLGPEGDEKTEGQFLG